MAKPKCVYIVGPTETQHQEDAIDEVTFDEAAEGKAVLFVYPMLNKDRHALTVQQLEQTRSIHRRHVDFADEVVCVNDGKFIDDSTKEAVDYALACNKPVTFTTEPGPYRQNPDRTWVYDVRPGEVVEPTADDKPPIPIEDKSMAAGGDDDKPHGHAGPINPDSPHADDIKKPESGDTSAAKTSKKK